MKNKKIAIIAIVGVLVFGLAFAGFRTLIQQTPEEELRAAEMKTTQSDSYTVEFVLDSSMENDVQGANFSLAGEIDYDRLNQRALTDLSIDFSGEGLAANFGGQLIYIDDTIYGSVTTFPYLILPVGNEQVDLIVENDILIMENVTGQINLLLSEFAEEMEIESFTLEDVIEKSEMLSEQMWKEGVMEVVAVEGDYIGEDEAQRYLVEVDGDKMADFYLELIDNYDLLALFPEMTDEEKEEMLTEMEKGMREAYEETQTSFWVVDGYLVKAEIVSETSLDRAEISELPQNELPEEIITNLTLEFSNFDQDFEIEKPEEYITLQELLEDLNLFPLFDLNQMDELNM